VDLIGASVRRFRDHPAHRCGRHEGGRGRTGIERVWKERGKAISAGHPMAGKENSGVEYADADLFQNAVWFLTPLPGRTCMKDCSPSL